MHCKENFRKTEDIPPCLGETAGVRGHFTRTPEHGQCRKLLYGAFASTFRPALSAILQEIFNMTDVILRLPVVDEYSPSLLSSRLQRPTSPLPFAGTYLARMHLLPAVEAGIRVPAEVQEFKSHRLVPLDNLK